MPSFFGLDSFWRLWQNSKNNFVRFFGSNENKKICFRNLLTFKREDIQDSDLSHFLEDGKKSEKLSEIKPALNYPRLVHILENIS